MDPKLLRLEHVDYTERGKRIEIMIDGVLKSQTVIFSGVDFFGEKYYFAEQGLRYIQDARLKRQWQYFVLNYPEKIPRETEIIYKTKGYKKR